MATERNVVDFKIHNLTEEQFQELKAQGKIDPNAVYCTPDESLKRNQITNCITEIPQDIKLELNNGTLTLKAGSKVYVPNGAGVFNKRTATTDVTTQNLSSYSNGQYLVFDNSDLAGTSLRCTLMSACYSGATAPAATGVWYDTTNNKIMVSGGGTWSGSRTLPLGIVTISNGAISSIDQVFNGFGYIGSTVFALPGICALAPDGRNKDGTLRNIELKTTNVSVYHTSSTSLAEVSLSLTAQNNQVAVSRYGGGFEVVESLPETGVAWRRYYVPSENYIYAFTDSTTAVKQYAIDMYAGTFSVQTSAPFNVTALNPKMAFRAVDYSDFENTVEEINSSISDVDSNAVHKTGDETIGGTKTFSHKIQVSSGNNEIQFINPSLTTFRGFCRTSGSAFAIGSSNASGWIKTIQFTDTKITAPTVANTTNDAQIATTAFVKSVLSSNNVGLAQFSKAQNGYYKFSNGLIIQWGTVTGNTLTYPTAFSSATSYAITANIVRSSSTDSGHNYLYNHTSTGCKLEASSGDISRWIAIGY